MTGKEAVAVLVAAFRAEQITAETIALYEAKLNQVHVDLLERTMHRVLDRSRFFPSIAEILDMAAELSGQLPVPIEEALAIIRGADISRPIYRRDGTLAYVEMEWAWPPEIDRATHRAIRTCLARVGESRDTQGKPVFGWELGFKAAYTRERDRLVPDLTRPALPPPDDTPPSPAALSPGDPPPPEFYDLVARLAEQKAL